MQRSRITALVLLASCAGVVETEKLESDPEHVRANDAPDGGPLDDPDLSNESPVVRMDAGPKGCVASEDFPLAQGLHIRELALYQAVKVPLFTDGAWVSERVAPVIVNKKALLRVFVDLKAAYVAHDVRAVLRLVSSSGAQELVDERTISVASTDVALASTFSFQIDAARLAADTELSVSLHETSCSAAGGAVADARIPATGTQVLEAQPINPLKVVIVPVNVGGRLPLTDAAELAKIRAALLAYYPVPAVELTVRSPLVWQQPLEAQNSDSWSDLLSQIMRERRTDGPDSDVYYFGLVQPGETFRAYCARGCVLGLAPQTTSVQAGAQVALGASFADPQTYETVVHELGHAHGRGHTPCVEAGSIDGVDPDFPDKTGATLTWGWDSRSSALMPPTDKDIMGYCEPNWIGAYNYKGLAVRSLQVNQKALRLASGVSWQSVVLYADGRARWGGDLLREDPAGEYESAQVLDASGRVVDTIEVVRLGLSHAGAQFLYLPQPGTQWSAIQLKDRTLQLRGVLPAL